MTAAAFLLIALVTGANGPQDCPMHARDTAGSAPAADTTAARSPYSGEESRAIKALSEADLKAYRDGTGMGLARPAELNQYPGPRHVLDNAEALDLSAAQRAEIEASFRAMKADAMALGRQVVEAEGRLDALFADRVASPASVSGLTHQIAELQGRLRAVHLRAHVETRARLTPEQVEKYVALRGYGPASHQDHAGH